ACLRSPNATVLPHLPPKRTVPRGHKSDVIVSLKYGVDGGRQDKRGIGSGQPRRVVGRQWICQAVAPVRISEAGGTEEELGREGGRVHKGVESHRLGRRVIVAGTAAYAGLVVAARPVGEPQPGREIAQARFRAG